MNEIDTKSEKIVQNVMKICEEEKRSGRTVLPLAEARKRAAMYTGLSISTCRRFAKMSVDSQKKRRKTRCDKNKVDSFDRSIIRRTVFELIEQRKEVPTLKYIMKQLKQKIAFNKSSTFLRRVLRALGFVWSRCSSNRTLLMERNDVAVARLRFLRNIKQFREDDRPIIYTDETYVQSTHCAKKCCQSSDVTLKIPFTRGERLIIVHAGWEEGFIHGAELVFKSRSCTGDYHNEMNGVNFNKWLTEKLIPNLPPRSVVVVDNAPYHNLQQDKCPTQTNTKQQILHWLQRNNIEHKGDMLKSELIDICRRNKPEPRYILDETLKQHSHDCLLLPPYHAELNAIELIWSQVKGKIGLWNMTYSTKSVEQLTKEVMSSISAEDWSRCCRHVQDVEEQFWASNVAVERAVERFIIHVSDEEATDTASECSDYSDTDSAIE